MKLKKFLKHVNPLSYITIEGDKILQKEVYPMDVKKQYLNCEISTATPESYMITDELGDEVIISYLDIMIGWESDSYEK